MVLYNISDIFEIQIVEVVKVVLLGEKIVLAPYTIERCHAFYKDYVADPAMTYDEYTYDKDKVDNYYQSRVLDASRLFFAICLNDKIIGEIQLKEIDKEKECATIGIHLNNDSSKGKGYGTEAQRLLIVYAINTLGFKTIYADAVHRNQRSRHILQKLGFEYLGDDDTLSYYKLSVK